MAHCLIDVQFIKNEDDKIFAKKILICGILSNLKLYTKEILFPYPQNDEIVKNDGSFDANNCVLGNLEIQRSESEIIKGLHMFNIVLVNDSVQKKFISLYIRNKNTKIVNLDSINEKEQ
jgi:hypothetical protein